jgi:hypothetical protein
MAHAPAPDAGAGSPASPGAGKQSPPRRLRMGERLALAAGVRNAAPRRRPRPAAQRPLSSAAGCGKAVASPEIAYGGAPGPGRGRAQRCAAPTSAPCCTAPSSMCAKGRGYPGPSAHSQTAIRRVVQKGALSAPCRTRPRLGAHAPPEAGAGCHMQENAALAAGGRNAAPRRRPRPAAQRPRRCATRRGYPGPSAHSLTAIRRVVQKGAPPEQLGT